MKKGIKLKYRGIGFDIVIGDYDMRLKELFFVNVIFFLIKFLLLIFLNWKKNFFSGRKIKDG